MEWPFGDLVPFSADIVLADPPWAFALRSKKGEGKSPQKHYACISVAEMKALPVHQLLRGTGICVMWATWPMMVSGDENSSVCLDKIDVASVPAAVDLMRAWGFRPVTGGAWFKRTKHDKPAFGTGYVFRSACEPFIVGTMGSPLTAKNVRNVIETLEEDNAIYAPTREHSRKPDLIYDLCARLAPRAAAGVELFARQAWSQGPIAWQAWGNEADKFSESLPDSRDSDSSVLAHPTG